MQPLHAPGQDEEDEDEEDDEDDDRSVPSRTRSARELPEAAPNRRISPFDIHFSQVRCRAHFRDGRGLETSIEQIRAVPCEEPVAAEAGGEEAPSKTDGEEVVLLEVPFPPIEVLKWRCKLRDEQTGRPRIDAKTGGELVDRERYFSLDNRRLYCLQKAAASVWPKRAVIDVIELPPGSFMRQRQLKKFRTLDRGRSIMIGCRAAAETQVHWSWKKVVGATLEDSEPDEDGCQVQMRRRPRAEHRAAWVHATPASPPQQRPRRRPEAGERAGSDNAEACETVSGRFGVNPLSAGGLLFIFLIYVVLRVSVNLATVAYTKWR